MRGVWKPLLGGMFGLAAMFIMGGDEADAQCCAPPPPPCCTPPSPPPSCCTPPTPPTPPENPCCTPPGHSINVPGVNVNVAASVVVNAAVNAQVNASANAGGLGFGGARGNTIIYGGGGGYGGGLAPNPTVIGTLDVQGGQQSRRVAYEATREKTVRVVIQAFCLDDSLVPHPASQVFPERDVEGGFAGEIYRCIAGTRLQYTWAEYFGNVSFDGGQTITCEKQQALWFGDGKLECRRQKDERDCNERSLLRRFGAGIKVLTMTIVETYTAYREEVVETGSSSSSMSFSGGVGGYAY